MPGCVPRLGEERFRIGVARSEQIGHLVKFLSVEPLEVCSYNVHECCRLPEPPVQDAMPLAPAAIRLGAGSVAYADPGLFQAWHHPRRHKSYDRPVLISDRRCLSFATGLLPPTHIATSPDHPGCCNHRVNPSTLMAR